ncbi:MAG TPA: IPTL-CTERM sorting domain-containing protein [Usitatibacter sp.]|nr:IPTL-CTERM sorting domain-containing protein [Usitatibacter sp.]
MHQKFSKLRFGEFTKTATLVAVGGVAALQADEALAVPATGSGTGAFTINAGNATWFLNNNIACCTTSSNWGFSEGSLSGGVFNDAFDGAISWLVSTGVPGAADGYRSPGGTIDISPAYPTNPAAGTTATGTVQVLAGLNVHGEIYFSPSRAVARSMIVLQNPTGAPITVNVGNMSNWGSDSNTQYRLTSSGDAVWDPSDNWTVSEQENPPGTYLGSDPPLTMAYQQNGSLVRGTPNPVPVNGSDSFYMFYNGITIPPGQTRRLMVFVQMSTSLAAATSSAPNFSSPSALAAAGLLTGLTPASAAQIVNWNGAALAGALGNTIPTLGEWGLIALGWLLGLFGMRHLSKTLPRRGTTA